MEGMEKIVVRLPADTVRLLRELVDRGEFESLSDAVLQAVGSLVESRLDPCSRFEVLSRPEADIVEISALVRPGALGSGDEVRDAVRAYLRSRM